MTDTIPYVVISNLGEVEIRKYPEMILATVSGGTEGCRTSFFRPRPRTHRAGKGRSTRCTPLAGKDHDGIQSLPDAV